ncbi:MAG: NADH-quinone oxidoreductase subunit C [Nitrosopumilaceae archaeon]|nr:NADH-quinone oxidoreductase subunit C [Nitrosopumilaceae archaeon]
MSSADTTETKDTKKKRTRKPRTTKSKTKKSEEINPPAETTTTEITTPSEQEVAPALVEEIVPETEEKVETEDVVPQVDLPKFEKSLADKITQKFGSKAEVAYIKQNRIRINVKKEDIKDIALYIRDELNFDHAESVSGVDYPDAKKIEVVYHLGSYTDPELSKQILALATSAPREEDPNPGRDSTRLPSLREIFYSVEFHERECFEMLGVYFDGHPDNRRLLLPEDWADIPPLRKDFAIKGR